MGDSKDLKDRTKRFAVMVIRMVEKLPRTIASEVIVRQLVRASTSIGANYGAACRARSPAEFIAKLQIALEESDEAMYWMELTLDLEMLESGMLKNAIKEANELTAIFVSALKTSRREQ